MPVEQLENQPKSKQKIVCWFSCGVASAVAVYTTLLFYPDANIIIARCVVDNEHPDNDRFHTDVEQWLNRPILRLRSNKYIDCWDVWEKTKYLSGPKGARCTIELKKAVRWELEIRENPDYQVFGFTAEEIKRYERFQLNNPEVRSLAPLIDANFSKEHCKNVIRNAGIEIPRMYKLGFANNNCIGCVKASSPTYWARVRKYFPANYDSMVELSRRLHVRLLLKGNTRFYLDELLPSEPYDYIAVDEISTECGIACSTEIEQE